MTGTLTRTLPYRRPRVGVYAEVDGVEYEAEGYPRGDAVTVFSREDTNPAPELLAWHDGMRAWSATVPIGRCTRLAEVTSVAEHEGHLCQVVSIDQTGNVGLYYIGTQKSALPRDGFVQVDAGTWAKTVGIHDIDEYREQHRDLKFESWWRETFPQLARRPE